MIKKSWAIVACSRFVFLFIVIGANPAVQFPAGSSFIVHS